MARSRSVYVVLVQQGREDVPQATFTVKHELVSYVAQYSRNWARHLYKIYKMPDGDPTLRASAHGIITQEIFRLADEKIKEEKKKR